MTTNQQIVSIALRSANGKTTTGNMSTRHTPEGLFRGGYTAGALPAVWWQALARREEHITQVIYSYSTPIAWLDSELGWIVPRVTYSITTSAKHQTHRYRLGGRHLYVPADATPEDLRRVLSGELIFADGRTYPGPNYKAA